MGGNQVRPMAVIYHRGQVIAVVWSQVKLALALTHDARRGFSNTERDEPSHESEAYQDPERGIKTRSIGYEARNRRRKHAAY